MFLAKKIDDINVNNIITNNKIKNNIMNNSYFYRVYYSTKDFTSNGIVTNFTLKNIKIEKSYNKKKIKILTTENNFILNKIIMLEKQLLDYLNFPKKKKFMIKEQIDQHFLKVIINDPNDKYNIKYSKHSNSFKNRASLMKQNSETSKLTEKINVVLKISGFWESNQEYGLTFRIIAVTDNN